MKIFKLLVSLTAISTTLTLSATTVDTDTMPDRFQMGSQQLAYPVPKYYTPSLTADPKGYTPFHMEHYGRHGSRWLLHLSDYQEPVDILGKADSLNALTPEGQRLLATMRIIRDAARNHDGELTPLGHRQHREIARRMIKHFPALFTDSTNIDAKSTQVIRCILSMGNEIAELEKYNPRMRTRFDASRTTQGLLAHNKYDTVATRLIDEMKPLYTAYDKKVNSNHSAFLGKVFKDAKFAADSLKGDHLFHSTIDIAVNSQSHDGLYDIYEYFTDEELFNQWRSDNVYWYRQAGNTPLTRNRVPFKQDVLLENFIESVDTTYNSPNPSVNLRFGHESIVLPLTILMELGNSAYSTDNLDQLSANWRNYTIFPMASNIQLIFYRPTGKTSGVTAEDVLVKVLLNEKETTFPVKTDKYPYYRWSDVRNYYLDKLKQTR